MIRVTEDPNDTLYGGRIRNDGRPMLILHESHEMSFHMNKLYELNWYIDCLSTC